nr:PREDICTED: probable glucuronokinase 2 [Latimeria chalumnae]|eukprot:XP_014345408.1 PREDICTED: probable glucuronokinase 2 [Latimeria chalumnae]
MICILLVAGHGAVLETEIKNDSSGLYSHLEGVPKALLPGIGGKKILDFWWEAVKMRQLFSEVYLVTNADKYKHYERWATANDFPVENIINDGTTMYETRLGAVSDLELVIRSKKLHDDVMVIAADMLCADQNFDVAQVIKFFTLMKGELAIYYEMEEGEKTSSRGIVEVCANTHRITKFYEKPCPGITESRMASVVFYCLQKETLSTLDEFLKLHENVEDRALGKYLEWVINDVKIPVYGMKLPTGFQLIGQVRIGIMGNPSDGFCGKTIAMTISNFWAEVTICESKSLVLVPHPLNDPTEFGSLQDLYCISRKEGYQGGLRLLQATCKKFYQFCSQNGIALAQRNFTLKYDTNIPRQVGLAGSSAIVSATVKCLMKFYTLTDDDLPKPIRARLVLNVETDELFITAGLQDRVVQWLAINLGYLLLFTLGNYTRMDIRCAPPFWIAYLGDPSDSGKIHSDVRHRWLNGDPEVLEAMKRFAELADQAKTALESRNWTELANLMNENFDLRRSIYTDACLGPGNLKMVELARQYGSAVKLPGSGGAVVGLCLDPEKLVDLKAAFQEAGCVFCHVVPYDPS